ncbi:MAG: cysteine desulfurase [Truepera sp.]|nr:cysteine desulfurase [Truepera sp.]
MVLLNPSTLRQDFPILSRQIHGKPLIYFDNAASSQKPRQVVEAMVAYYYQHHANVHRGAHTLSVEATELYEEARRKVARFINAPNPESLLFTRNTTEALNLVAQSWGRQNLKDGDEIIVSEAEHHANLIPWQLIAERTGAVIKAVRLTPEQRLDLEHCQSLLSSRTKVVAIAHMSNILGVVNPIRRFADLAHSVGAVMVVDGAQAVPHLPVDVQALGADFYAFSGHKMCGPTGAGALWARAELLRAMPPFLGGGEMIRKVYIDHSTYADIPMRFEAGTPNIAEVIGLGAAVDYLSGIGMQAIFEHDQALARYALERLEGLEGITLYGPRGDDRGGIIPFNLQGIHPHDVATALDSEGIAVRAGHHCAQPLMRALGVQSTARASFYFYNTEDEVERFVEALVKARDFFATFA